jgi:hypothetical protein
MFRFKWKCYDKMAMAGAINQAIFSSYKINFWKGLPMGWLKLRIKGPDRSKKKNISPAHLFKVRQVLSNGEMITEKIMSASYPMTIEDFRKNFDYPLGFLNIKLAMQIHWYICLCKDGVIRYRSDQCDDSGITVAANGLFERYYRQPKT